MKHSNHIYWGMNGPRIIVVVVVREGWGHFSWVYTYNFERSNIKTNTPTAGKSPSKPVACTN